MFGLQGPEAYVYTSASNCLEVSDIDDAKDYHDTIVRALQNHGFLLQLLPESYGCDWSQPRRANGDIQDAFCHPLARKCTIR